MRPAASRPLRRTSRPRLHLTWLRRRVRLQPRWPWWAAWATGGTVLGAVAHVVGGRRWWLGPPAGLIAGWLAVAATALDDVRRPLASLRTLAAEIRWPAPVSPGRANAVRADAFDIPLYAPIGRIDAHLRGGGASFGPRLFSAARPRLGVSWGTGSERTAAQTVVGDDGDARWVDDAWFQTVRDLEPDSETGEVPWPGPPEHLHLTRRDPFDLVADRRRP